jgi:hypothetical protein
MQQKGKNNVLNSERKYIGEFYDHADQLLDNLDDIKDVFDKYLAVKLYNWRYKWFCDHYESEEWTTDDADNWSFGHEDITFDSIPYNVCMKWPVVLDKYFDDDRPIYLPSDKHYSDMCRAKLDNGGIVPYYFRCCIPFPDEFIYMLHNNSSNEDGESALRDNLTQLQLEDFEKEQNDYMWV